jgi:hypothetical protein
MSNETQSASSGGTGATGPTSPQSTSTLAFFLVVIMLVILLVLVVALLVFAGGHSDNAGIVEYSKWALSTLLGAFGAWIGAGAAYFFGRENLNESSRSTEAALRIQQEALRGVPKPERIRELALKAMNKEFMFNPTAIKSDVIGKLTQYSDYWWVPVLDEGGKGILVDIIHARVFWDTTFKDNDPISKIVSDIDIMPNLKALHGASFFVQVALDDKIADVIGNMKKSGAVVGVIVDEKGKPTYCFTKQDLL